MALVLSLFENLGKDKHVESVWFPRLDEGSNPSRSTLKLLQSLIEAILCYKFSIVKPCL